MQTQFKKKDIPPHLLHHFNCIKENRLLVRNHICWFKSNAMPESVTDRFSKKWESIFMFTKQPKYYFNLDDVRMPNEDTYFGKRGIIKKRIKTQSAMQTTCDKEQMNKYATQGKNAGDIWKFNEDSSIVKLDFFADELRAYGIEEETIQICLLNTVVTKCGDVWSINTQPSPEKHFAMFPEKLVERMILCSTKPGDTVLDCFAGSGTTLRVADKLNRIGLGIDLGYDDIQSRRLSAIQKELL